ncbi:MAG: WecB/TagA/CpsF family glycosyltransferase [Candidatus Marinimicrobia bacterium]|nr:WecB/TagA/CpsF family glycosyltransferase [Candidatus Neomarinimicrobiota bacterium]
MKKYAIEVFNLKIHPWDMQTTLDFIETNIIKHKINMQHIVINVAKVVNAQKDEFLRNAINNSDLVNIDGLPVVWVLKILGYKIPERVTGVDLFQNLVEICAEKGYRPYFLGAEQKVVEKVVTILEEKYPNLQIAGFRNGYFNEVEEINIAQEIKESKADMLFLGISSPKKEIFIDKYTKKMDVPFTMGVGGSFDIIAGKTKRAPLWMQNSGLEWFYRILQEPRRMWKRYAITNTLFIIMVVKEIFRRIFKN